MVRIDINNGTVQFSGQNDASMRKLLIRGTMNTSGEVWILNKIADLTHRCGISPAIAEICIKYSPENSAGRYCLVAIDGSAAAGEEQEKVQKVWSILGLDELGCRHATSLRELEAVVNSALAVAPRSRGGR